ARQWAHEYTPERDLAALRRHLAGSRLLRRRNPVLRPDHHDPLRNRLLPDRPLRPVALRADSGGPRRAGVLLLHPGQHHLAARRGDLDRHRARPHGDPHVREHHRDSPGHRQPQAHPRVTDAAGQGHRGDARHSDSPVPL
ncbi:MAG: Integral membrane protein, partial [uncultured Arthrobacter sp.]